MYASDLRLGNLSNSCTSQVRDLLKISHLTLLLNGKHVLSRILGRLS